MDVVDDFVFKIPLKRSSHSYCFYGVKGSGKTIAMSYFALYFYLRGKEVCSNYHLVFPHTYVNSIEELQSISNTVAIFDDFERWSSSRFISNKNKSSLLDVMLDFGKANISPFLWSCKVPLQCDKAIRVSGVDYYVKCNMLLKYAPRSIDEYNSMSKYLDAHVIEMTVYDAVSLKPDRVCYLDNLDVWCELYDTKESVKDFNTSPKANKGWEAKNFPDGEFLPTTTI